MRSLALSLALVLGAAAVAAADEGPEGAAARRAEARDAVVKILKAGAVRAVPDKVVVEDARELVAKMTDEQIGVLLERGDLAVALATGAPAKAEPATSAISATSATSARARATAPAKPDITLPWPPAPTAETAAADAATAPAVATPNPGDPQADLLYVPLAPCRVIDTRLGGGKMAAGETRSFHIAGTSGFDTQGGNSGGCGVPIGASTPLAAAVMINLVAVDVDGKGNLAAWAFGQSQPLASSINYQKLDMNIANGLIVPISGVATSTFDMNVKASFANAHLVADVTGYFTRFPVEQFQGGLKSTVTSTDYTTLTDMSAGACTELTNCAVTATSDGTVLVEGWTQWVINHTAGTRDRVSIAVETASPVVCNTAGTVNASDHDVSPGVGTNPDVDFTLAHFRTFHQSAGSTVTYRLSGQILSGASTGDSLETARIICTFIPD